MARGGATFLTKLTAFCATAFFLTSLGLSFVGLRGSVSSQLMKESPAVTDTVPAPVGEASPSEANPKPPPTEPEPSAKDAVPANK